MKKGDIIFVKAAVLAVDDYGEACKVRLWHDDAWAKKEDVVSWTPCEEGLPEEPGYYLVTLEDGTVTVDTWEHMEGYGFLWRAALETGNSAGVIAWMPLPEPYGEVMTDE